MEFTCPCCGFITFADPPGSHAICAICGWKDDALQLANPCSAGGTNGQSLADAQENFAFTTPEADLDEFRATGSHRDVKWRRLNINEKEISTREIKECGNLWSNNAINDLRDAYWNRNLVKEKT